MRYTPGHDKLLFVVGTHRVMSDKRQLVIQHPSDCPGKGSRLDKYKTFHRLKWALEKLETCGVQLDETQLAALRERGLAVAAHRVSE